MIITSTVKNGRISKQGVKSLQDFFQKHEGKQIQITAKLPKSQRSVYQNAYYWGVVIQYFMEAMGEDLSEDVHEYLKTMFLSINKVINGEYVQKKQSTASLNTKDFSDYIERCRRLYEQIFGGMIPSPDDVDLEELAKKYGYN